MDELNFRKIAGYDNYMISENGIVLNTKTNKYMSNVLLISGVYQVKLSSNGKAKGYYVHRLVADAFVPNDNNLPCVIHNDLNKLNNHFTNLKWTSHVETNSKTQSKGLAKNNTSGVTGVFFCMMNQMWNASITKNKVLHELGLYENFEDAKTARLNAEKVLFPN